MGDPQSWQKSPPMLLWPQLTHFQIIAPGLTLLAGADTDMFADGSASNSASFASINSKSSFPSPMFAGAVATRLPFFVVMATQVQQERCRLRLMVRRITSRQSLTTQSTSRPYRLAACSRLNKHCCHTLMATMTLLCDIGHGLRP